MYTIYDVQKQFSQIIANTLTDVEQHTNNRFWHNSNIKIRNIEEHGSNNNNVNLAVSISGVNLETIDSKNFYYKIDFNLVVTLDNEDFKLYQKETYYLLERLLQTIHSMEFYYCYKINNLNIKSTLSSHTKDGIPKLFITLQWTSKLNLDTNWFN